MRIDSASPSSGCSCCPFVNAPIKSCWRLHCQISKDLKEVVLDYIADGPSLIVKTSSTLYAEVLCHGDLDALDVVAIPKSFRKSVGEAEGQHVVYCSFAQIVVDAKDVRFVEDPKQDFVKTLRRGKIVPEWLFDDNPRTPGRIRFRQLFHDGFEKNRRNGQVMS